MDIPRAVAVSQGAWDRAMEARRIRKTGVTFKQVGLALGVGVERARQLAAKADRLEKRYGKSPVELWSQGDGKSPDNAP
jgi:hypothetical protein